MIDQYFFYCRKKLNINNPLIYDLKWTISKTKINYYYKFMNLVVLIISLFIKEYMLKISEKIINLR